MVYKHATIYPVGVYVNKNRAETLLVLHCLGCYGQSRLPVPPLSGVRSRIWLIYGLTMVATLGRFNPSSYYRVVGNHTLDDQSKDPKSFSSQNKSPVKGVVEDAVLAYLRCLFQISSAGVSLLDL